MTISGTQALTLGGRSSQTITNAGRTWGQQITVYGPTGTYTLQDAFVSVAAIVLSAGTFNSNNFNVTAFSYAGNQTSITRALIMGSSVWTFTAATGTLWNQSSSGFTLAAGTSTIVFSVATTGTKTFNGGGFTYNIIQYNVANSPGALAITGANTIAQLIVGSGRTVTFPSSTITTITGAGGFQVNGQANGYLYLPGVSGAYASTPNAAPLQITGNITVDAYISLASWTTILAPMFVAKAQTSGQYSWSFYLNTTPKIAFDVYYDGTNHVSNIATSATGFAAGSAHWIRASINVSSGGNNTCQFYTSSDGATWSQLGTTVTNSGTTSIFNGTSELEIGTANGGTTNLLQGNIFETRIFSGALGSGSGTPVFDADFTDPTHFGKNSWAEKSSNAATVTINGALAQAGDGRVIVNSSTPSTPATLTYSGSGVMRFKNTTVQDITGTPANVWYAE